MEFIIIIGVLALIAIALSLKKNLGNSSKISNLIEVEIDPPIKKHNEQDVTIQMAQDDDLETAVSETPKTLKEVNTSLMLKKGEVAYFDISSTLSETRAERTSQSVFAGKRQKNIFFGGSQSRSKSHQVLTTIDKGSLILTNKRLVFDGKKTNRNIKLNKLLSVEEESNFFSSDQLEISVESRKKSMYFSVEDMSKYKDLIMQAYQEY